MAPLAPQARALRDLWAAHRELSTLEWLEFRQTVLRAAAWLCCAAVGGLAGWLALNAGLILVFRERWLEALLAIVSVNLVGAAIAGVQARRLLRRPFFALAQREAARDLDSFFKVIS